MKILSIITFLLLSVQISNCIYAQTNQSSCGFVADEESLIQWEDPNSYKNKRLDFVKNKDLADIYDCKEIAYSDGKGFDLILPLQAESTNQIQNNVPVVAHIIRNNSGNGGITEQALKESISRANNFFNPIAINFELCDIKFIDDDELFKHKFDSGLEEGNNLASSYNVLNVIRRNVSEKLNIYFVPNSNTSWAWGPSQNPNCQHIIMFNVQAQNNSTLAHELGHWFDLLHTHGPTETSTELVKRDNCTTDGDRICDTAADPNLSGLVKDDLCIFDKQIAKGRGLNKDRNGDEYQPDTRNVMAYTYKPCRNRFSKGQIQKIHAAYKGMRSERGYFFVNCDGSKIYPLLLPKPVNIDWRIATDLPIYSGNNPAWAECISVVLSWRDQVSYNVTDLTASNGNYNSYFRGLKPDVDKIDALGLFKELATSYTVGGLADMMQYGPVWILSSPPSLGPLDIEAKSMVILAMNGDGTPENTFLNLFDPADRINLGIRTVSYKDFITEIENEWAMEIPGSFYMVHP